MAVPSPTRRQERIAARNEEKRQGRLSGFAPLPALGPPAALPRQGFRTFSMNRRQAGPSRMGAGAPFLSSSPVQAFGGQGMESMNQFELNDDDLYRSIFERLQNGS